MREINRDSPSIRVKDYYVQVETAEEDEQGLYLVTHVYKYNQVAPGDIELKPLREEEIPKADLEEINEALNKIIQSGMTKED